MTERKPANTSWESWIERQIREAQRGGAFDDLDGHGRPLEGIDAAHDEMWWVKAKLRDEDIKYLPPTIAIRGERAAAIDAAMRAATEHEVRVHIDDVNNRIRYVNSHATAGPPSSVVAIDLESILARWRAARPEPPPTTDLPVESEHGDLSAAPRAQRWWRRALRRRRRSRRR